MVKKYFGTDGIRGVVNSKYINGDMFFKFGLATGTYFKTQKKKKQIAIIAKDTRLSGYSLEPEEPTQATQSVQAQTSVFTEERKPETSLLPNKSPKEQYDFALSFMKVGDYETAELTLREFIDKNKTDELAGSAQYWYGETFRIRQLYSDAATAYLDGYQNYPKSKKAAENLLKLGTTMVELGEKDQGCKMITGIKKEYPKASQSVLQKAQYEQKRFKCSAA